MTDSGSFWVVFCDVLAERFVTKDGEKPAVGDAAKGLRAFTSESKNVSVTGVDLLLAPHPRNGFKSDPRPPDHRMWTNAKATSKQRKADVLVERLLPKAHLVELLRNSVL